MAPVRQGRFTAVPNAEPVTVFLIGMRINAWWKVHRWLPIFLAMPRMQRYLDTHPESGYLSGRNWFGRTTIFVSYWRSPDDVIAFARDPELNHLPAWRRYNAAMRSTPDVGVWHETYQVSGKDLEQIYVHMPPFGLGKAHGSEPVGAGSATAKQRLARTVGSHDSSRCEPGAEENGEL